MKAPFLAAFVVVAATGCTTISPAQPGALATLAPTQGNTANGTVRFSKLDDKVVVEVNLKDLTPGLHGFHVHDKGDCSAPDGSSAGGHFNPTGAQHGSPTSAAHHLGDLPMLVADDKGRVKLRDTQNLLALDGPNSIIGKAVVVHAQADDFQTQPAGNSGARVACGVIVAE
jgi:Cu-Zn family superoxide dismutase